MCGTVKTSEFMTTQVKLVVMNSNVFTVPNYSCDCACNLCDILSGTYKFCNLYMYLSTTQFPVGFFFSGKKPSACLYKPTTGADHPQSVPIGLVTIFTTNSMDKNNSVHASVHAQTFSSDLQHKMCSKRIHVHSTNGGCFSGAWCSHLSNAGW